MYQCDRRATEHSKIPSGDPLRFVYVGSFDHRKGADLLLQVATRLPDKGGTLTFVGSGGEYQPQVHERDRNSDPRVHYDGTWQSDEVLSRLARFDVAIVPSRHDGWGVVVNESLEAGLGTIVSDNAGSAELIAASGAGTVVPADNVNAITSLVEKAVSNPEMVDNWKRRARQFAPRIRADVVGQYLIDVLEYSFVDSGRPRPDAPWLTSSAVGGMDDDG